MPGIFYLLTFYPNVIISVNGCIFFLPGAVIYPLSSSPSNKALGSSKCNVETWWKCSEVRKNAKGLEVSTKKWKIIFSIPFDNLANLRNSLGIQNSLYCRVLCHCVILLSDLIHIFVYLRTVGTWTFLLMKILWSWRELKGDLVDSCSSFSHPVRGEPGMSSVEA